MLANDVSVFAAFIAGLLLFFTPCVLPLIPVYLGYISGISVSGLTPGKRLEVLSHALLFVFGFSVVFILLGASVGFVGFLITDKASLLRYVFGATLIVFGLFMIGVLKIPFLMREFRYTGSFGKNVSCLRSFLVGAAFAFVWSPCIGPILGAILTLAYGSETATKGAFLLSVFSLGLAVPFLASALAIDFSLRIIKKLQRYVRVFEIVSGGFLVALGILALTDTLVKLNNMLPYSSFLWQ